jgi:hypothetical protein
MLIEQWFFGVDTETDWKVGSPLVPSPSATSRSGWISSRWSLVTT